MSVSGILVSASPGDLRALAARVAALPGVCVHHRDDATGRLVVTLEADGTDAEIEGLRRIQCLDGVVAADLVYHNFGMAGGSDDPEPATANADQPAPTEEPPR